MKALLLLLFILLFPPLQAQHLVEVGSGYSGTSVNTTIFRNNSIVTHKGVQYTAYYDSDGYMIVAKRALGKGDWQRNRSPYKGNIRDAHNVISLMVDGAGYLHVSFDHHGHPLRYCRSIAPGSTTLGQLEPMLGTDEQDVTYPEFYTLTSGNLLFAYRSGASGRGNLVLNKYDVKQQKWERVQSVLIDGENKRNAYWQLYVDDKGTIHLSWVWRETWMVETNHDLCYARSTDDGKSWYRTDGTPYQLPITLENAEYAWRIPENSELINQTSMSADAQGNPYIATYWRDADSDVPQYRLVWHNEKGWQSSQVTQRTTPFSLKGGGTKMIPIARPRMVAYKNKAFYIFRDEERGSKVSMAYTANLEGGDWKVVDLTDFPVHAWEPSLDSELWKKKQQLHLFVQQTHQGDGERTVDTNPTPVYVLELDPLKQFKK